MRAYRSTLASGTNAGAKYTVSIIKNGKSTPLGSSFKGAFAGNTSIVNNVNIGKRVGRCSNMFAECTNFNQNVKLSGAVIQCDGMFKNCTNLDQNIRIPDGVSNCGNVFYGCSKLNQSIKIPDSAYSCYAMFCGCSNLNQSINIPSGVRSTDYMFDGCSKFNQPVNVNAGSAYVMFRDCTSLNQNIQLLYDQMGISSMFSGCSNLNQNIKIPQNVSTCNYLFYNCTNLNQNIKLPTNKNFTVSHMFYGCSSLNQRIEIPVNVNYSLDNMFCGCTNLDQPIDIPDHVVGCTDMFRDTNMSTIGHLPNNGRWFNNMFMNSRFNDVVLLNIPRNQYGTLESVDLVNMFANSKMSSNIYIYGANTAAINARNMLSGCKEYSADVHFYRGAQTQGLFYNCNYAKKKTVHCLSGYDNSSFLNSLLSTNPEDSLTGTSITWTADNGGYYNSTYNIYVFNDLVL